MGKYSAISLDLGGKRMHMVQLARAGRRWQLHATASVARSDGSVHDDVLRLSDVLFRRGFEGRRVVLCASGELVHSAVLDLPVAARDDMYDKLVRAEFIRMNHWGADDFQYAWWRQPGMTAVRSQTVLSVATASRELEPVLTALDSAGLQVHCVDTWMHALARAGQSIWKNPTGLNATLDMGYGAVRLVVTLGGGVVYVRSMSELGVQTVAKQLAEKNQLQLAQCELVASGEASRAQVSAAGRSRLDRWRDALATELERALAYGQQQCRVSCREVAMVGGTATQSGLAERLATALKLPVRVVSPSDLLALGHPSLNSSPDLMPALGAALHKEAA